MADMLARLRATAFRRLGSNVLLTVAFGILGALTGIFSQLPDWIERISEQGVDAFLARLPRGMAATLVAALFLVLLLRLCTERAADLTRRPALFALIVLVGGAGATLLGFSVRVALSDGWIPHFAARPDMLLKFWLDVVLWFGLVGWLYLLSLQRAEDRATLAGLLGRRAALGRQLAHVRLGAARAQVDPAEVAKVLAEVRERYRDDPPAASALLDQLIGRLRRAMDRGSRESQRPSTEPVPLDNRSERHVADPVDC